MENIFKFKATMSSKPTMNSYCSMQDIDVITKAASASLLFDFSDKVYEFEDVDQFIYIIKQGNKLIKFQLYTYLTKTADTSVMPDKTYYTDVFCIGNNTLQCVSTKVENPTGNPSAKGYYEEIKSDSVSWRDTAYTIDNHFTLDSGEAYSCLTLVLDSKDTAQFKAGSSLACEVALRLNTETINALAYKDSIIIEPQPSIIVQDSLYSKIM